MIKYYAYYEDNKLDQIWVRDYSTHFELCLFDRNHNAPYNEWLPMDHNTIRDERRYQEGFDSIKQVLKKDLKKILFMANL